jgi:bacteriocin-like protein
MTMKLTGDLKKKADQVQTKEEAKEAIKKAGELLTDDELEQVSGGEEYFFPSGGSWVWRYECWCGITWESNDACTNSCPNCGDRVTNGKLVRKGDEIMK